MFFNIDFVYFYIFMYYLLVDIACFINMLTRGKSTNTTIALRGIVDVSLTL